MKIPTHEAARALGMHPANLILHLLQTGITFEDAWPSLDDFWINVVRKDWQFSQPGTPDDSTAAQEPLQMELSSRKPAEVILEKLWRKHKWGNLYLDRKSLEKMTHLSVDQIQEGVKELLESDLLMRAKTGGETYSLNPAKKGDIEHIVSLLIQPKGSAS